MEKRSNFIIYGLVAPDTQEIRYIGKSTSGLARPSQHQCPSTFLKPYKKNKNLTKRQAWLKSLYLDGMKPLIVVLCSPINPVDLSQVEIDYIKYYKDRGARLVNGTSGGEGVRGAIPWNKGKTGVSDKTRKRMSRARMGKTPWNKGRKMPISQRKHLSNILSGNIPANASPVICINTGEIFETTGKAASKYGTRSSSIYRVCIGERKTFRGLKFEYYEKRPK